jgi:hypothetical protein
MLVPLTGPRLVQVGMSARIFAEGSIISVRAVGPYRGRQNRRNRFPRVMRLYRRPGPLTRARAVGRWTPA